MGERIMGIRTVGVAGLGIQGRDIAACLVGYGFHVIAFTRHQETHESARSYIAEEVNVLVQRMKFDPRLAQQWSERYTAVESLAHFASCEFVIETIVEDVAAKQAAFDQIEAVAGAQVTIASNTSAIPISQLQRDRKHPQRFVGMHWGEPAHISRFMEVIRGQQTSQDAFDAALRLGRAMGKEPSLVQQDVAGFVGNRIGFAIYREALSLLALGVADVETIDRSFRNAAAFWATLGGPFREMDLTGGPTVYAPAMQRMFPHLSNATEISPALQELAETNALGIANGRGFYQYTAEEAKRWEELFRENAWQVRALLDSHFPLDTPCS
jgi:3-hydroxybutyryl-CoA dehydrogenase